MNYLGDFLKGAAIRLGWNSSGANGASLTPSAAGTIYVYKDGDTSSESTAGLTDTRGADSLAGVHFLLVDTSNAFYTAGSEYTIVLKTATIDSQTVNAVLGCFSIQRKNSVRQVVGVAQGGAAGYIDLPTSASSVDGSYAGAVAVITGGTGAGQSRYRGSSYTGSSRRFTVDPNWDVAPDNTSIVEVLVTAPAPTTGIPDVNAKTAGASAVASIQAGLATSSAVAALPTSAQNRDTLLSYQPWTGFSLARWFRVMGALWRGPTSGQNGVSPVFTAPDGSFTVTGTLDSNNNRTSVTDTASNTP